MKILYVCRLYSGFEESFKTKTWNPKGAPTIARMIEHLDTSDEHKLHLVFTQKDRSEHAETYPSPITFKGINSPITVLPGYSQSPIWLGKFREKWADCLQLIHIIKIYKAIKPDIIYCDRANIVPAAIMARFFGAHVIWRVMGVLGGMHQIGQSSTLRSRLIQWLWCSPFKAVICTRDGSGGGPWMNKLLHPETSQHLLLNGVNTRQKSKPITTLPKQGTKVLFVGRLEKLKGIKEFLEAFYDLHAKHPDARAVIAGDGSLKDNLIKEVSNKNLSEHIHFLGSLSPEELKYVRKNCDFYVSLNKQGNLSNVNLEALSDHLPTIIPAACNEIDQDTSTLIPNDVFHRFGRVGDTKALIKAMNMMMQSDIRNDFRINSEILASKILPSWAQRIRQELDIYETVQPHDLSICIADLGSGGSQKVAVSLAKEANDNGKKVSMITLSDETSDFHKLPKTIKRISLTAYNQKSGLLGNINRVFGMRNALKTLSTRKTISFIAPTNVLCILACLGLKTQCIISERNDPARQSFGTIWDKLRRLCYPHADIITANSKSAVEHLNQFIPANKLHYVPNALEQPKLDKFLRKNKNILIVGRLHPQKNHAVLLKAFSFVYQDHKDWSLIIAGDGPLRTELEELAQSLGIAKAVQFKGIVKKPELLYQTSSIFVLPSLHEGTPNALLEAMSYSLPAIVSDACEGAMSFIENGESGYIVPVNNAEILAKKISFLINNSAKRNEAGKKAYDSIETLWKSNSYDLWKNVINI